MATQRQHQAVSNRPIFTIGERRPARPFLLVFANKDGSLSLYRTTLDDLRQLDATYRWRYEVPGEAGVYPTMEEWNAIHGGEGCATPCQKCKRAGYDPLTGQTKGAKA